MSVTAVDLRAVTAGPGRLGQATHIGSAGAAQDLAHWLLSPNRDRVVVVVSAQRPDEPPVDPDDAARVLDGQAEVYLVPHGAMTRTLTDLLPDRTGVSGNAVRIYPARTLWRGDPHAAPRLPGGRVQVETLARRVRGVAGSGPQGSSPAHDPTPSAYPVDGGPTVVDDVDQARDLAGHLLDPQRARPVVVVSVHPAAGGPYLDPVLIADELRGLAPVVVVGADASFGLTDGLGDKQLSVFYGAGRVYPVGLGWVEDMYRAPLHLCTSRQQAPTVTRALIDAGLTAAHQAGLLQPPPAEPTDRAVTARVDSVNEHHFAVRSNGHQALARTATLALGIPGDRLLRRHQRLTGRLRGGGLIAEFVPDPIHDDPAARVRAAYPTGSVALARVDTVQADRAVLLLHPAVRAVLTGSAEDTDLAKVLSVDDTVAVHVSWSDTGCTAVLADTDSVDTLELAAGVSLLPDGPPWLVPADLDPEPEPDDQPPPVPPPPPVPAPGPPAGPAALMHQLVVARDAAEQFATDADHARAQAGRHAAEVKRLRADLRKAHATIRGLKARNQPAPVFADPATQLRHEIGLAYLARVTEPDRPLWPLPETYLLGSGFVASLTDLDGIDRTKVLEVVVDVLTGRARDMSSRGVRAWKETRGGTQQVRGDGAKAYRVNLQNKTPSARRMKYWHHADGRIELDFVGLHDDGLD